MSTSFFDMSVKESLKNAFKEKEKEARLGKQEKKATYGTISPASTVGKAAINTKGTSR